MKIQIDIDDSLWRETKAEAAMRGMKLKRLVEGLLRDGITPSGERKQPKVKSELPGDNDVRVQPPKPYDTVKTALNRPTVEPKAMSAYVSGVVYPDEVESRHKCAICHESFPESEMTYHAKALKWACKECLDKQV